MASGPQDANGRDSEGTDGRRRRILIVDDHPIVRLGMRHLIDAEPDLTICCEAESAEQALEAARSDRPDLIIVDLSLGAVHGLELVRHLHRELPQVPVLVLSMHDEALFAERVLRAGARGYIMKAQAIGGLLTAVRQVLSGRIYLSERMSQLILAGLTRMGEPGTGVRSLTNRELEVFDLVGHGAGTAEIAQRLGVSVKTVETYRSNIKTKLGLKDAHELVRYASSWVERP